MGRSFLTPVLAHPAAVAGALPAAVAGAPRATVDFLVSGTFFIRYIPATVAGVAPATDVTARLARAAGVLPATVARVRSRVAFRTTTGPSS